MNQIIELINAGITLKILPHIGGRIVHISLDGHNNILQSNPNDWDIKHRPELSAFSDFKAYNGHIVWVGPQSDWWKQQKVNMQRREESSVWPPDPFIIYGEYTIESQTSNSVVLISSASPVSGIVLKKEFVINNDGTVYQKVTATNVTDKVLKWDLWFNTRLHGLNLCYVPVNYIDKNLKVVINQLGSSEDADYTCSDNYFTFLPQQPSSDFHDRSSKAFIYPQKPYMYGFTDDSAIKIIFELHKANEIHPEQGLVEIYNYTDSNDKNALLEMEYHSPYTQLMPGDSMEAWEVWELYKYDGARDRKSHIEFIEQIEG